MALPLPSRLIPIPPFPLARRAATIGEGQTAPATRSTGARSAARPTCRARLHSRPLTRNACTDPCREWKNGWRIHYRTAGADGPPLVLLTGFGVGGFHYARNIDELAKTHRVWCMDVLGQGK